MWTATSLHRPQGIVESVSARRRRQRVVAAYRAGLASAGAMTDPATSAPLPSSASTPPWFPRGRTRRTPSWRDPQVLQPSTRHTDEGTAFVSDDTCRMTSAQALCLTAGQLRRYHLAVVDCLSSDPHYRKDFVSHSLLWQEALLVFPGEQGLPPLPVNDAVCRQLVSAGQHLRLESRTAPAEWPLSDMPMYLVPRA